MNDELNAWPDLDPTQLARTPTRRGGDEYGALMAAQRIVQARLAGLVAPTDVLSEVTARLDELARLLADYQGSEADRFDGRRPDLPGRGSPLLPPYVIERVNPRRIEGRVTFSRFHLGGRAALHGGVHPLLFDDALGSLVNIDRSHRCRTASLKVNYRRIAPIGVELTFDATVDEISGRKRFTSARLYDESGAVCADAEGLFLELLPGQQ